MPTFESLTEDDQLLYAHALERKGRELAELILRKRRVNGELGPMLAPADQEAVLAKIHAGLDGHIQKVRAEAVALEAKSTNDPDAIAAPAAGA